MTLVFQMDYLQAVGARLQCLQYFIIAIVLEREANYIKGTCYFFLIILIDVNSHKESAKLWQIRI